MKNILSPQEVIDLNERWVSSTLEEQNFVVNFLQNLYPDKKQSINEARWWNTVGDVLGIFDPTGVVDLINGLDYIRQGDYFYGFLSMIAVIPYVGDAVAKPIMGVSKGSKMMKGVNEALRLSKMGKPAEAAKILETASKSNGMMSGLVKSSVKWGEKLKSAVNMIPGGKLTGGLRKTINDWVDLFMNAAKKSKQSKIEVGSAAKRVKQMNPQEATQFIKTIQKSISSNTKIFKNFKPKDPGFMAKYFWPGATVGLLWRNRALTSLARRTKWYAGFLSSLGLPFMEPEELPKQTSEEELNQKFQQYVSSEEGKRNWQDEFSQVDSEESYVQQPNMEPTNQSNKSSGDALLDTFDELFGVKP
jgi:hypothetical protein